MNDPFNATLAALERVTGFRPVQSGDEYKACCPVHEADGRAHTPSLSVRRGDQQAVLMNCHAGCQYEDILVALGLEGTAPRVTPRIVATYPYRDAAGAPVFEKVRYEPKAFRIRHQAGPGAVWRWKRPDLEEYPLYRLPELLAAKAVGQTIFVVEGEKDANRAAAGGLVATCNWEGASEPGKKPKWRSEYTAQLAGAARVVLIPDNDDPGRAHMQAIAQALRGQVEDVRIVELPDLPEKGDLSDWLNAGHTVEDLLALIEQTPAQVQEDVPAKNETSRAHGKFAKKSAQSAQSALSITYSYPSLHEVCTKSALSLSQPFSVPAPDLETVDEKGRCVAVIDSFAARSLANALHGRLAFCRDAMVWHGFTGTHWQPFPAAAKLAAVLTLLQEHGRITQVQRKTGGRTAVIWKLLPTKKEERSSANKERF